MDITFVLIGIIILFSVFVALRSIPFFKVCALCGAVSVSWIVLLFLFYLGYEIDPVLIGILMGGSIVGFMYLLEQKLPERYQIFKLPFLLSLISVAYFLLVKNVVLSTVVICVAVWILSATLYIGIETKSLRSLGKKIIECCKNW